MKRLIKIFLAWKVIEFFVVNIVLNYNLDKVIKHPLAYLINLFLYIFLVIKTVDLERSTINRKLEI